MNRIAIFIPELSPGGAERSMLKLAGGICDRGYPVDLLVCHTGGSLADEAPEAARVIDLRARRVLASVPALIRYLRRERPAALLSILHANPIAVLARRLAAVPTRLVVSERNTLSSGARHYAFDLRMRLMPGIVRVFYPLADRIVAVSAGVADDLAACAGIARERIRVIYNPIVTGRMKEMAQASLDHPWFERGAPPVILAVGRLTAQKDFSRLIEAFALVRQSHRMRLMILGEGEERTSLLNLVRRRGVGEDVSLPGYVPNPYPYMKHAYLFVLSSLWEGLPGVLIEALYCGAPIIATDCPSGAREILADGRYGRLVPVGGTFALAEAIRRHMADPIPRPSDESWQQYKMETIVSQYLEVLYGNGCS